MTKITRRTFNGILGGVGAAAALGVTGCANVGGGGRPHVVVVGGGFGGATAAKYIRRRDPSVQVTLIEPSETYYTCPFSNTVIAGINRINFIAQKYNKLADKYDINVIHDRVEAIDPAKRTLVTAGGTSMSYDRMVMSPGISFKWGAIDGYDEAAAERMPHAWNAGQQTELLRKQLAAMDDGGTVLICPPKNPFRCPPGPYERASLIAYYLKRNKPRSKVLILDPKDAFAKQGLFVEGWDKMYADLIEWVPAAKDGTIASVSAADMTVESELGEVHKGDVINVIPPQQAGAIAVRTGLTDGSGFCPVDQMTFESTIHPGIHVIGDASIASPMPKSGYSANSQGKAVAAAVVAMLKGQAVPTPGFMNTCYSLLAPDYGISVAAIYRMDGNKIAGVKGAGGVSPTGAQYQFRKKEADFAEGWYASIAQDSWA